jgi:glycosyltransferase involved in cell wall biosynthesis
LRTGYQGCIRAVRRQVRELSPHLVHGQGTERDCAMAAVFSGFPNVITLHGNMVDSKRYLRARPGSFYWCAALLEQVALKRAGGVFCNSLYTETLVRPRTRRTWRVPNAVRLAFFEAPLPAPSPPRRRLLNVGVVANYKRQLELLEQADALNRAGFDFEIAFAGHADQADPYGARFLARIREAQQKGYARFVGSRSVEELIALYDATGALLHVSAMESFGLAVAEALSRNLKFFGFRVGGVPDIAEGVPGAELFADGDWRALRAGLAAWMRAGYPLPQGASQVMRARYHPDVVARKHLEIYREVASTRS